MSRSLTFERLRFDINGTTTVVLQAGPPDAPPLVFFHGGGTFHGWDFAADWIDSFRVIIPFHPGYGESGDDPDMRDVNDLVIHYTALFDEIGLGASVNLVGFSLGGLIAARFAISQRHRLRRLVLVAPAGLRDPLHPAQDLFTIAPEEIVGRLVHRMDTILPFLPADPMDIDFTVDRYREERSTAVLLWDHPLDRVISKWLGRVDVPSLVVWGENDQLIPSGQAQTWADLLPNGSAQTFPAAGHLVLDESVDARRAVSDFLEDSTRGPKEA